MASFIFIEANSATRYKNSYEQLKELKSEIEHLQYLLEHARHRLTRDFEHWYINVYMDSEQEERTLDQVSEQISQDDFSQVSTVPVSGARAAMQAMRVTFVLSI